MLMSAIILAIKIDTDITKRQIVIKVSFFVFFILLPCLLFTVYGYFAVICKFAPSCIKEYVCNCRLRNIFFITIDTS